MANAENPENGKKNWCVLKRLFTELLTCSLNKHLMRSARGFVRWKRIVVTLYSLIYTHGTSKAIHSNANVSVSRKGTDMNQWSPKEREPREGWSAGEYLLAGWGRIWRSWEWTGITGDKGSPGLGTTCCLGLVPLRCFKKLHLVLGSRQTGDVEDRDETVCAIYQ